MNQRFPHRGSSEKKRSTSKKSANQYASMLMELEQRIAFDGAAVATVDHANDRDSGQAAAHGADAAAHGTSDSEHAALVNALDRPAAAVTAAPVAPEGVSPPPHSEPKQVVFVDSSVADYQELLNEITGNFEVVVLDKSVDGVEQMANVLKDMDNVQAIHIISHGAEGMLTLGSATLSATTMGGVYADELQSLRSVLSDDADILVYGCDFAKGAAGDAATRLMSSLTGADVAASTDATGAAHFGGDWDLERTTGTIETAALVAPEWDHLLAPPTLVSNTTNLVSNGSFTTNTTGWTTNSPGAVERGTAAATYGISGLSPDAGAFVEVESTAASPNTTPLYVETTITTVVGQTYEFSLFGISRSGTAGDKGILLAGGVNILNFTTDTSWQTYRAQFTATSTSTVIRIISDGGGVAPQPGDGAGLLIDGVAVRAVANTTASYTEGGAGVQVVSASLTIQDADSTNAASAKVVIANVQAGDVLFVSGALPAGIAASYDASTGTLTLTGSATKANYETALKAVRYVSNSQDPVTTARTVNITVNDGSIDSLPAVTTLSVAAANDLPVIDLNSGLTPTEQIANGNFGGASPSTTGWTTTGIGVGTATGNGTFRFQPVVGVFAGTLTQSGLAGWNDGTASSGAAQLSFNMIWANPALDTATPATLTVSVGGVVFAQITTGRSGSANPDLATIEYFNGATGDVATVVASNGSLPGPTFPKITISLPASIAASGSLVFSYAGGVLNGDPISIGGVSVLRPVDATAGVNFTAAYSENGAAVSISAAASDVRDADNASMQSASIVLTNAQAGDVLSIVGTLPGGISSSINTGVAGQITVTLTGAASKADYAAAIHAITFSNTSEAPSTTSRTINVTVNDGTNNSAVAVTTITVASINDAPVNTIPAGWTTNEDVNVTLTGLAIADDATSGTYTVTLSVPSGSGTLTAATAGSVTVTGSTTNSLVLSGTLANINAFLAGASAPVYRPAANANGPVVLTMLTSDGGNTGTGGTLTDSDTATITINAINDAPVNTVPAAQSTTEDTAKAIPTISVADVDSATLTTTLSVANGTVTVGTSGGAAITGNGTGTVTLIGTAAQINAALVSPNINYVPVADFNGVDVLTVVTNDGAGGIDTDTDTVNITVTAVADISADTASGVNATNEDTAKTFNPITGINVNAGGADSFENTSGPLKRIITSVGGTVVANGAATGATAIVAGGPAVAVTNGMVSLALDGETLTFTPNADFNGTATFAYTVSSGGVFESANISITVTAVADAPRIDLDTTTAGTGYVTTYDQDAIAIGNLVSVTDPENNNLNSMTVTLSGAQAGDTLLVGGSAVASGTASGIAWTRSGNTITFNTANGTLANYQAALGLVTFSTTSNVAGARTVSVAAVSSVAPTASNDGVPAVATITLIDTDSDGTANAADIDDDNDGTLDIEEGSGQVIGAELINSSDLSAMGTWTSNAGWEQVTGGIELEGSILSPTSTPSYIAQTISTIPGRYYQVTAAMYARSGAPFTEYVSIQANGTEIGILSSSTPYNAVGSPPSDRLTVWFRATSTTTEIRIQALPSSAGHPFSQPGDGWGEYLDSVSVKEFVFSDPDGDGIVNRLDLDSDNDGITDNVEAQTTQGYIAPSGQGAAMVDIDNDGLDDVYDANTANTTAAVSLGLTPVDTDSDGTKDYVDSDADGDGVADIVERGDGQATSITSTLDTDQDGLFDIFEAGTVSDGFDVNDNNVTGTTQANFVFNLGDSDSDMLANGSNAAPRNVDFNYRDDPSAPVNVLPPVGWTTNEDATVAITGISVTDNAANGTYVVQLTVASGTLAATSGGNVTVSGSGTSVLTLSGLLADINAYLAAASAPVYTPVANNNGTVNLQIVTKDGGGGAGALTDTDHATITINPVNDAPVLDNAPVLTYTAQEDDPAPVGAVGALISAFTGGSSDVDAGALKGIAITAAAPSSGTWWYTTDGGTTWLALGAVSNTSALLLADNAQTRLYFQATTLNFNGTGGATALTFRAWDQTSGVTGTKVTTATNGGTSAFSIATDTVAVTIAAVNDAPVMVDTALTVAGGTEDVFTAPTGAVGTLVSSLVGGVSDVDAGAVKGIAVIGADTANGVWWFSTNNGTSWSVMPTVSNANALLLTSASNARVFFQPNVADWNGVSNITIRGWDTTGGFANGATTDVSVNGGITPFSLATDTAGATVAAVADILADTANGVNATNEDTAKTFNPITGINVNAGGADSFENTSGPLKRFITSVGGTVVTNGAATGATAIVAGGPAVAVTNGMVSLALDGEMLTFMPNADFNGTATFAYTVSSGGVFESANISITVTAVADAPRIDLDTTTAGTGYVANYDQDAIAIGNLVSVTDPEANNLNSMTVTLSGAQAGDTLLVGGSAAASGTASGIAWTRSGNTITFNTANGTLANYQAALGLVTFSTTSNVAGARTVSVSAVSIVAPTASNDGVPAVATISLIDTDGDGTANAGDIDDDNDGILDVTESPTNLVTDGGFTSNPAATGWYRGGAPYTSTAVAATGFPANDAVNSNLTGGLFEAVNPNGNPDGGTQVGYIFNSGASSYFIFPNTLGAGTYSYSFDLASRLDSSDPYKVFVYNTDTQTIIATLATGPVNSLPDMLNSGVNATNFSGTFSLSTSGHYSLVFAIDPNNVAVNEGFVVDRVAIIAGTYSGGDPRDSDGDGLLNRLDLDSDNDGITDNVEAQTTQSYIAPSGQGAAMVDIDNDGLDDVYDADTANVTAAASLGRTPVDTDGDDAKDYLDADSDDDGTADIAERGDGQPLTVTSTTDTDRDGLLDIFEAGTINDGFDVNDNNLAGTAFNLADSDNDTNANGSNAAPRGRDLDYRDDDPPPAPTPVVDLDANDSSGVIGGDYTTTYTENAAGVAIADADATIVNVPTLVSASAVIANGVAGDVLYISGTLPSGIVATWNVATFTLSLTGNASAASYQAALAQIHYAANSQSPSATPRTINVVVNDGVANSNTAVSTINVAPLAVWAGRRPVRA